MNGLELVRFQKSMEVESSSCVKIPESSVKVDLNTCKTGQILDLNNKTGNQNQGTGLKISFGKRRWKSVTLWCFTFLFLWTLTTSLFSMGFVMGRFGVGKGSGAVDGDAEFGSDFQAVLKEIKSILAEFRNESLNFDSSISNGSLSSPSDDVDSDFLPREEFLLHQNKTQNHSAVQHSDMKIKLDFVQRKILDRLEAEILGIDRRIGSKMSSEHKDLEDSFTAHHTQINGALTFIKSQISTLHEVKTREMNLLRDEGTKQISTLKDQIKTGFDQLQQQITNQGINSKANPNQNPNPNSSALSAPRFYVTEQYKDAWFAPAPGWETKSCINMPSNVDNKASSVNLGGHCVEICPNTNCHPETHWRWAKECLEIHPDSYGLDNFVKFGYNDKVSSFRQCQTPK